MCVYIYTLGAPPKTLYIPWAPQGMCVCIYIPLLQQNTFFPDSHRYNGICINQVFFGGKKEYMIKILQYFSTLIYQNQEINDSIASTYKKSGISFNTLFKHYITNYLKLEVFYTKYNPKIYRTKNNMFEIH